MTRFSVAFAILFLTGFLNLKAQVSPDCSNAVPICYNTPINGGTNGYGIDDFYGSSVTGCIAQATAPIESNSAWYRFRTGERGQLGINIGFDISEDWDFALYRASDCNTLGDPIRCNYFDNSDNNTYTGFGVDPTGADNFQYDDWLDVESGEDYYLFINNFSNNNSGFSIQFSGSIFIEFPNTALDCSIINNLLGPPIAACDDDNVVLDATTLGAIDYEWFLDIGNGYQQIPAENSSILTVAVSAMYRVLVIMPTGDNTISEVQVAFSPVPTTAQISDELVCLEGAPIDFTTKRLEALGVQSANEFQVNFYSSLDDAINNINALPDVFIPTMASQTIFVRTTSVQNQKCFDVSKSFEINGLEVPGLNFATSVYICEDTPIATIGERIPNPNYSYSWDSGQTSSQITVTQEGTYTLNVSNTFGSQNCTTERSVTVVFSGQPVITDVEISYQDNANTVEVIVERVGELEYQLDGNPSQKESIFYNLSPGAHTVTVSDVNGCGSISEDIVIVGFPKFFTPNGDGVNDFWTVGGMSVLHNPVVHIYDRFGKLLYQLRENDPGWNGTINGVLLPAADYWFKLTYADSEGGTVTAKYINNHFSIKR
ncbi:T9SS type B sorting domain-containing protein [Maribacter sp. CXY002]|uniref:T9SS type B sorting domain-containing protein n=1 Tax=Maribacter luteocoastalis TaxID=3407671 RepID=UPI003B674FD7